MLREARRNLDASPGYAAGREATRTMARLAELYEAWGKPERAASYGALLAR